MARQYIAQEATLLNLVLQVPCRRPSSCPVAIRSFEFCICSFTSGSSSIGMVRISKHGDILYNT